MFAAQLALAKVGMLEDQSYSGIGLGKKRMVVNMLTGVSGVNPKHS